ncbi:MAG: DinB family protein [Acidimicrobiales bacterium]
MPPDDLHGRIEPAFGDDERTMLAGFLDYHRRTLVWKASGLTQAQLAQPLPSSSLTIGGLVKHMALVEDSWFTERFAGGEMPEPWASADWDADPDWEHHSAADDTPEQLLGLYAAACDRSRAAYAAASSLDQRSVVPDRHVGEPFTLRWMVLHMIEETARHNGHVDLLREAIDGLTGE